MGDLNVLSIDGQFYAEELTAVKIKNWTEYLMHNITDEGVGRGFSLHLVRWCDSAFGRVDGILPHYTKLKVTRIVSPEHHLEVPCPTAILFRTAAGCVRKRNMDKTYKTSSFIAK